MHAKQIVITYKIQSIYFKMNGFNFKNSYCHVLKPIPGFVTMTGMLISSLNLILIRTNYTFK